MRENPDQSNSALKRKRASSDKVKKLGDFLADGADKNKSATRSGSQLDLTPSALAAALFAKAPVDFLERRTLADLAAITDGSLECLAALPSDSRKVCVRTHSTADKSCMFFALGDRPFIVYTILECLREAGASVFVLLHPVILTRGLRISLSYIEFEPRSAEELSMLEKSMSAALSDLILVTEDFTSTLVHTETLARVLDNPRYTSSYPQSERKEIADFLHWLTDGGFIFLGHAVWKVGADGEVAPNPSTSLGLFRTTQSYLAELSVQAREDAARLLNQQQLISFSKLRTTSPVHRRIKMSHLTIAELSTEGNLVAVHSLIGFLTSKALSQESSSIPLIRRKLQKIIELEDVQENSFDYKNIVNIVDGMPEEEALRQDIDILRDILRLSTDIQHKDETRVYVTFPSDNRGAVLVIALPRDRFNTNLRSRIQQHAEEAFGAAPGSGEYHLDVSPQREARLYFYLPLPSSERPQLDVEKLKTEIVQLSKSWMDNFRERVKASGNAKQSEAVLEKYEDSFPEDYQALQSTEDAEQDVKIMETLSDARPVRVSMSQGNEGSADLFTLIVYHRAAIITISKALPILENAGLEVIGEKSSCLSPTHSPKVFIHRFTVRPRGALSIQRDGFDKVIAPGLEDIFVGKAENDGLNALMLSAGLSIRSVALLRTYCALLWQVSKFASRQTLINTLVGAPDAAQRLWQMFETLFKPQSGITVEQRRSVFNAALSDYKDTLHAIKDITKDRVLRSLADLLQYTLRTNFYHSTISIALKLHSEKIEILPNPRPMYEIFLSAPDVEGVHLRGSRVARGGIRWSDRYEDYRSEVLGLMKTQKIKNALIVPGGAKGGFIVKNLPTDPAQIGPAVESAYKTFVRSLLSITDNRTAGGVKHPEGLIVHDSEDPYLVVAADKGTATFSDTANRIATEEFNFWLGDAFASGGSQGYDHKIYAITAKGGWECVKRHFNDMGFDITNQTFSAVGIGDMSGDVFGNGLLLSRTIKLIAAFNHKHVFLDPAPDAETSYQERRRLFVTKGSQWSDYKKELISTGGGVFGRFDKEITLSAQIRKALGVPDNTPAAINGEQLINLILRAPVDLLWNGGIGTYVKSQAESHADVNDGTNDRVRINANELRAKVVAEGGNLGFTQQARIEFAQRGGHINTDAIDNSGGVDLSDHEVNLKILFAGLMREKKLTLPDRNQLLKEMAPDVVEAVLDHNRSHALLLSMAVLRSRRNIEYFQSLIRELHRLGYINRSLEGLPDDEDLRERISQKAAMWRPELAVCTAAVKMWVKDAILSSALPSDPLLKGYLFDYFPPALQSRFKNELAGHPLSANIIATQVANTLIDSMGITFVHRMCVTYSVPPISVIKCALAAEQILGTKTIRAALKRLDTCDHSKTFLALSIELSRALMDAASWLLSSHEATLTLAKLVELYESGHRSVIHDIDQILVGKEFDAYQARVTKYYQVGLDEFSAKSLAVFPRIVIILEMLWASRQSKKDIKRVAQTFSVVMDELGVGSFLSQGSAPEASNKWENELVLSSSDEIRRSLSFLTTKLLESSAVSREEVVVQLRKIPGFDRVKATLDEARAETPSIAALSVVAKQLRSLQSL